MISCAEDFPEHIALPRGCVRELLELLEALRVPVVIDDKRIQGKSVHLQFHGELSELQSKAAQAILEHDTGVLVAPTAFGKTVVAAWLIARRGVNTLVLVHTRQLMDQWLSGLDRFLEPPPATLLLAMPVSWKGTLLQYAGRLNRARQGKQKVTVYDYADLEVPMLKRMFERRRRVYRQLGYEMCDE